MQLLVLFLRFFVCCCNATGTATAASAKGTNVPGGGQAAGGPEPASGPSMLACACRLGATCVGNQARDAAPTSSPCSARVLSVVLPKERPAPYPAGECALRLPGTTTARVEEEADWHKWEGVWSRLLGPLLKSSPLLAQLDEEALPSLRQVLRTRAASTLRRHLPGWRHKLRSFGAWRARTGYTRRLFPGAVGERSFRHGLRFQHEVGGCHPWTRRLTGDVEELCGAGLSASWSCTCSSRRSCATAFIRGRKLGTGRHRWNAAWRLR